MKKVSAVFYIDCLALEPFFFTGDGGRNVFVKLLGKSRLETGLFFTRLRFWGGPARGEGNVTPVPAVVLPTHPLSLAGGSCYARREEAGLPVKFQLTFIAYRVVLDLRP